MVKKGHRPLNVPNNVKFEFHKKKDFEIAQNDLMQTHLGSVNVATVEQTIIDLLQYINSVGGIDVVASIIKNLLNKKINIELLVCLLDHASLSDVRRLGYILDELNETILSDAIFDLYNRKNNIKSSTPLKPGLKHSGIVNKKWNITINEKLKFIIIRS